MYFLTCFHILSLQLSNVAEVWDLFLMEICGKLCRLGGNLLFCIFCKMKLMVVVFICIQQKNQQLIAAVSLMSVQAIALTQLDVHLLKTQAAPLLGYLLQWMTGISGFHSVNWNDVIQFYFFFPIPSISQG